MSFSGDYTFLTTKPANRRLVRGYPELLLILPNTDISSAILRMTVTWSDATTSNMDISLGDLRTGEVKAVNIGTDARDYDGLQPAKTAVKVVAKVGTTGTKTLTYLFAQAQSDTKQALYYANSYGGYDSIICTGDSQRIQENSSVDTRRSLIMESSIRNLQEYGVANAQARVGRSVSTGYLTPAEYQASQDLFLHRHGYVYESVGGVNTFVPVIFDSDITWSTERSNLKIVGITYRYAPTFRAFDRVA